MPEHERETWLLTPTDQAVYAFAQNAERLRKDAGRCKSPAKLALLELSLEQGAIAAMLFLRISVNESPWVASLRSGGQVELRPEAQADPAAKLFMEHLPRLTDQALDRAMHQHKWSLVQLGFVLDLIEAVMPRMLTPGGLSPRVKASAPAHYLLAYRIIASKVVSRRFLAALHRQFSALRALNLDALDRTVKNNSLYARMDPDTGLCTLPTMSKLEVKQLRGASRALTYYVRGLMRGVSLARARRAPPVGSQ